MESARSAVVNSGRSLRSKRVWRTRFPRFISPIARSRATDAIARFPSRTNATASALSFYLSRRRVRPGGVRSGIADMTTSKSRCQANRGTQCARTLELACAPALRCERWRGVVAVGESPVQVGGECSLIRWRGRDVLCRHGVLRESAGGGLGVEVGAFEDCVDGAGVPASASWGGYSVRCELVGDLSQRLAGGAQLRDEVARLGAVFDGSPEARTGGLDGG